MNNKTYRIKYTIPLSDKEYFTDVKAKSKKQAIEKARLYNIPMETGKTAVTWEVIERVK